MVTFHLKLNNVVLNESQIVLKYQILPEYQILKILF